MSPSSHDLLAPLDPSPDLGFAIAFTVSRSSIVNVAGSHEEC
jgi:hypothetical protein